MAAVAHVPVFAYYYMWMTGRYWQTNKTDHPVQPFPGNYNSDNPAVINWQIQQAQAAGIGGFIVSWQNTTTYQHIVPLLEQAASQHHFALVMSYQSLNKQRRPRPVSEVAASFQYFVTHYASSPAWYRMRGKPLTVWDSAYSYPAAAVSRVTRTVRSRILVLNSASTVAGIKRLAPYTDGDAAYWSSINPVKNPAWASQLIAMGAAVHRAHGIWIAPFAPGFNASMLGFSNIIGRLGGLTLRAEYAAASAASPDLLGLISWNEWTENTYMEPSVRYGHTYLNLLKSLL
jgi:hypothetical protein